MLLSTSQMLGLGYQNETNCQVQSSFTIINITMEEIKIVIIILLTIFSYVKLRAGQKKLLQPDNNQKPKQPNISAPSHHNNSMQQITEEQNYQIDQRHIEEFVKLDRQLFPKKIVKPSKFRDSRPMAPETRDSNDIFGGEYTKCVKGKTLDMDNLIIYNRQYFQKRIFSSYCHGPILNNQQHLQNISHLLRPQPQIYQPFVLNSNRNRNIGMPQMLSDTQNRNTYNNFSFNFSLEREKEAMQAQDESQNYQLQDSLAEHKRAKKKLIFKQPKIILKRKEKQHLPGSQTKICGFKVNRKRKTFICLQDQIKKKEQQLEILKKLRHSLMK